jgi:hypothetical protein
VDRLVEMVPAMTFSTGFLVLGFVLVDFAGHGSGSEKQKSRRRRLLRYRSQLMCD